MKFIVNPAKTPIYLDLNIKRLFCLLNLTQTFTFIAMKTMNSYNFKGRKALIRVDFNVPLNDNLQVTDNTRIVAAIPTIKKIIADGGSVILMSHLGRPKHQPENKYSLKHILPELTKLLGLDVIFADDCISDSTKKLCNSLEMGKVVLLENLRFYKEEEAGDANFAKKLSELGDVYVNDAFGTAHRAHASTTIVANYFPSEKLFGYLIENELTSIDKVLQNPQGPKVAIMGGAKVSDKILIVENLLDKVNALIIGGGMAFTFLRAMGKKTGSSICEEDKLHIAVDVLNKAAQKNVKILLPVDVVLADKFSNDASVKPASVDDIPDGWMGLDIGPNTIKNYCAEILGAKSILWNGPMGVFEMSNFEAGTKAIALAVAEATQKGSFSLVGGGDSVAATNKYNISDKVSYVSTGGGALLEYMEGKVLPGIKAIKE